LFAIRAKSEGFRIRLALDFLSPSQATSDYR
jgi:hypothetical protein